MELTDDLKQILIETATTLKGADRRRFMAQTVQALGERGQTRAERELGWNRATIRIGTHELRQRVTSLDAFQLRVRKRAEVHLPICWRISASLWRGKAKPTPSFATTACIRA
ncbi:MAG: hypothetical protein SH847_21295 [Roseiflexaceae bacterium]|nr:hypothetical protein [Roseiflexaceae bacterium]